MKKAIYNLTYRIGYFVGYVRVVGRKAGNIVRKAVNVVLEIRWR